MGQARLFDCAVGRVPQFPSTRYQGSKRRLTDWIWDAVSDLEFDTVLDAFGGTGAVAYMFKQRGKEVTYNDILAFNHVTGKALIENRHVTLSEADVGYALTEHPGVQYPSFVQETFSGIFFTERENRWIDIAVTNIGQLACEYKRALAFFALGQSALAKRPFNLFHRKNLHLRTAEVKRSFGNKTTWDRPFPDHFPVFVAEANQAVFDNGRSNIALNMDALAVGGEFDLVYVDPPYVRRDGSAVDYLDFYHFLEGIVAYHDWPERVDYSSKHRKMKNCGSPWADGARITELLDSVFARFADSIIVVSYRADGIPSRSELGALLRKHKSSVLSADADYQYVLSGRRTREVLLVGI